MEKRSSVIDNLLLRIGLVSAGGLFIHLSILLSSLAPIAFLTIDTVLMILLAGLGLVMLVQAGLERVPDYLRWLILVAYVTELIIQTLLWIQTSNLANFVLVDPGLYTDLAGELVRRGHNPYTWDFGGAFDLYRVGQLASTPRLNGAPESNYPYPALAFLLVTLFQYLGLPGVFSLSILSHLATLIIVFVSAPRRWQPVVLLPMLVGIGNADLDFIRLTMTGTMDIVWVLAIIGMLDLWHNKKWRAILFGVAVSLKQSPALLAPFLLIKLWHEEPDRRMRRLAEFICLAASSFFIFNGPFILLDPRAWFNGYTEPLRDRLVILSQGGLSTLVQFGITYLPKSFFLISTVLVLCLLIFIYWRHYDWFPDVVWALPGILMWFSYRSLAQYWLFWIIPSIFVTTSFHKPILPPLAQKTTWKPTIILILGTVTGIFILGTIRALPDAPIEIDLQLPMFSTAGRIDKLTVDVTNNSIFEIEPRFGIQSINDGLNPLPWTIIDGPMALQPGQNATYQLSSSRTNHTFFGHQPAQLVVTDAHGDYAQRGVLTIEPDRSYLWPDAILNPDFRIWDSATRVPLFWTLLGNGTVEPTRLEDHNAIRLISSSVSDNQARVALANTFLFPNRPIGIWIRPPADDSAIAYGLEIAEGNHRLWILFGPQAYTGTIDDGVYMLHCRAPANIWTYQEIDLMAAYTQAGWPLPPLQRTLVGGLNIDVRRINLQLFFISRNPMINEAAFGAISQVKYQVSPQSLMAEVFDNPAGYYVRLAEAYVSEHNLKEALDAYKHALFFTPDDQDILKQIERLNQRLPEIEK